MRATLALNGLMNKAKVFEKDNKKMMGELLSFKKKFLSIFTE